MQRGFDGGCGKFDATTEVNATGFFFPTPNNEVPMEITASMVKELRERSGAGMMECKKALTENNGDIDTSIEWLR